MRFSHITWYGKLRSLHFLRCDFLVMGYQVAYHSPLLILTLLASNQPHHLLFFFCHINHLLTDLNSTSNHPSQATHPKYVSTLPTFFNQLILIILINLIKSPKRITQVTTFTLTILVILHTSLALLTMETLKASRVSRVKN